MSCHKHCCCHCCCHCHHCQPRIWYTHYYQTPACQPINPITNVTTSGIPPSAGNYNNYTYTWKSTT